MDILKLDLRKYKNWLWELSEAFEGFQKMKERSERLVWIGYLLTRRGILGRQTARGKEIERAVDIERERLQEQMKRVGEMWFGGLLFLEGRRREQVMEMFFLPSYEEREELDLFFEESLKYDIKEFIEKSKASPLPINKLIEDKLGELSYRYVGDYVDARPVLIMGDRERVFTNFVLDYCRFLFAEYLQGLNGVGQVKESGNSWSVDKNTVLEVLKSVGVIDKSGKTLIKGKGSSIVNGIARAFMKSGFFIAGVSNVDAFYSVAKVIGYEGSMPKNPNNPQPIETETMLKTLGVIKVEKSGK